MVMDRANSAPHYGRKPLGDGAAQANHLAVTSHNLKGKLHASTSPNSSGLPHHESLAANGGLTVRNMTTSPENKRLSALTNEDQPDSKRNSQVSNASTTVSAKARRRKTHIGPWQLGRDIGKGGSGNVRKVRHRVTGEQAAVKVISKRIAEMMGAESLSNLVESSKRPSHAAFGNVMPFGIEREVVILKLLDHPNIVKLYDVWENRSELYLVMEYCDGGELFDYIDNKELLGEDEAVWLFRQMLAALIHCSRLGIHHRDLKPENVLLDLKTNTVKIVDFGMAALQPRGSQLTTPCGSIHYAAPEVFDRLYDGSKIDVWSLGVILYVMLTGSTPFVYDPQGKHRDMKRWQAMLKTGRVFIPPELSIEAQDLITRMLNPNPAKRIALETIWRHPLMLKYCEEWQETPESTALENWVGSSLIIGEWMVTTLEDIDREILRNLRTLWHSVKEEVLIAKILSPEPNQEKYFYYALQKHREEQLENFVAEPQALDCSTSDYHHMKKNNYLHVPQRKMSRTKSQYSILNDEHLHSRSSFLEPPPSERSYDPYRASRNPITARRHSYTAVTLHRDASRHSRKNSLGGHSLKPLGSLRIEALKKEQRRLSAVSRGSSAASLHQSTTGSRIGGARSISRASMGSSILSSGSPITTRPSAKYKRPVNFSHLHRSSTASALGSKSTSSLSTPKKARTSVKHSSPDLLSSPGDYNGIKVEDIHVISKKENQGVPLRPRTRRGVNTHSMVIENEARKVSTELEQFCEQAFYKARSSASSSHATSNTANNGPEETPPSSVSNLGSTRSHHLATLTPSASLRPLPDIPAGTPNTVVARELAETKKRLQALADQTMTGNSTYTDIIAQLDNLIIPRTSAVEPRRVTSMPEQRHSDYLSYLPPISEEDRINESEVRNSKGEEPCSVSASNAQSQPARPWESNPSTTIRMVDNSSPPRPAPLNIRKLSPPMRPDFVAVNGDGSRTQPPMEGRGVLRRVNSPSSGPPKHLNFALDQGVDNSAPAVPFAPLKKRTWWKRMNSKTGENGDGKGDAESLKSPPLSATSGSFDRYWKRNSDSSPHSPGNDVPDNGIAGKRPGFLRFLRRSPKVPQSATFSAGDENSMPMITPVTSVFSDSDRSQLTTRYGHSLESGEHPDARDLGVQQSWFARFLHIKPATRILCFQSTRGRIRSELMRLLRGWRAHGIQDVIHDKTRNLIFARLDASNVLGIKEVEFVIELFVVLHSGARKGLSIARFTQRKGAASSLRRVGSEIETRMSQKKYLVEDKFMRKEMEAVLNDGQQTK